MTNKAVKENNTELWENLGETDPDYTRQFTTGRFSGTDINPQWRWMKLTQVFGPCGIGWGIEDIEKSEKTLPNDEIMINLQVTCWYKHGGEKHYTVPGYGSDYLFKQDRSGNYRSDDEAYKKAMTEALGNAFKYVGLGADVFMGLYDDSKYVDSLREKAQHQQQVSSPPADAADKGEAKAGSSPASADASPASLTEQALGEHVDGIVDIKEGVPVFEVQPDKESWGTAAQVFDFTLNFCSEFDDFTALLSRNLKVLDQMKEHATGDYGQCMEAIQTWIFDWIGPDINSHTDLTKKWATISKKVNGMKRTMPDFYEAITAGFKARKAQVKED